jgi:pyruvate dehydrogenase E1 component beta subunit
MRKLTYAHAINEALSQALGLSPDVVVLGQLVDYQSGVFGTTTGLAERFGAARVRDFPVAESVMTSTAIGAALVGMRPVLVHQRMDFMMYSLDAIVNWLSLWRFKSNGRSGLPVTIRAIVGKGWGQGPQHSKSLHAWFAHLPGLRVAVPSTAHDAKGLLLESIFGEDPAIIIENRSLFSMSDEVPEYPYRVRFGRAAVRRFGSDVTLVAIGAMVPMALRVAALLAAESIDVEVLDLRTVSPVDTGAVCASVAKTKRLAVADPAWQSAGVAAEVIATVCEKLGRQLEANPVRIAFPDSHTPMSAPLEEQYYPDDASMARAIRAQFRGRGARGRHNETLENLESLEILETPR